MFVQYGGSTVFARTRRPPSRPNWLYASVAAQAASSRGSGKHMHARPLHSAHSARRLAWHASAAIRMCLISTLRFFVASGGPNGSYVQATTMARTSATCLVGARIAVAATPWASLAFGGRF